MKIIQGILALLVCPSLAEAGRHGGTRGRAAKEPQRVGGPRGKPMKGFAGYHGKMVTQHEKVKAATAKKHAKHGGPGAKKKQFAQKLAEHARVKGAEKKQLAQHPSANAAKKQLALHARAAAAKKKTSAQHARAGVAKKKDAERAAVSAHRTKVKSDWSGQLPSSIGDYDYFHDDYSYDDYYYDDYYYDDYYYDDYHYDDYWSNYTWAPTATPLCDWRTQETCYDDEWNAISCADHSEGCPCPAGEVKCGADEYWSGYCTAVCCDWETQETCYDGWTATSCAAYDVGCPCPDGEERCGGNEYYSGYCTAECDPDDPWGRNDYYYPYEYDYPHDYGDYYYNYTTPTDKLTNKPTDSVKVEVE